MPLKSDLTLNPSSIAESSITEEQRQINALLIQMTEQGPNWWEVGAPAYRKLREEGKTAFPPRTVLASGSDLAIPSRSPGRSIPCRSFVPTSGHPPRAIFMHIHGGGWVLQSEKDYDPLCQRMANDASIAVVTVGYRLAPEHKFPAAPEDCYDVADWLVEHGGEHFGVNSCDDGDRDGEAATRPQLEVIGGESAGAQLSVLVTLHLLQKPTPYLGLRALVLHYGAYDVGWTPSARHFKLNLILPWSNIQQFAGAYMTDQQKVDAEAQRSPDVSPLYADYEVLRGRLPPALFTCGTLDALLDDTLFLASKWLVAGAEAVVRIRPGLPHGYATFSPEKFGFAEENLREVAEFLGERVGR